MGHKILRDLSYIGETEFIYLGFDSGKSISNFKTNTKLL